MQPQAHVDRVDNRYTETPPIARRQAPYSKPPQNDTSGLLAAHFVALCLYFVVWCLNAATTIAPFVALGMTFGYLGLMVGAGACFHMATSLIEHYLWRSYDRATYPLIFIVGLMDIATATLGLMFVCHVFGIDVWNTRAYIVCTIIAEVVAIASEPMMVLHWRHLRRLLR